VSPVHVADALAEVAPSPHEAPTALHGDETVLVVEDDPFVRQHVIASLESLGYRVMVASDGREALDMLQTGDRPALLFTDVVMPGGMNGMQLAEQARRIASKVLFTSGYPQEALASRGQVDPDARILTKPYRKAELARRVREALDED
jgi:CheY-like chemotaxis protein